MHRYIAIFLIIAALVFGVGYLALRHHDRGARESRTSVVESTTPFAQKKDMPEPALDAPDAAQVAAVPVNEFLVVSTEGSVERRGSDQNSWKQMVVGDRLRADESIKTAENSSVKLSADENSEVELAHSSELTVRELAQAVHRLNLVKGRIHVDYNEHSERVLSISVPESDAVAETRAGKFAMQRADDVVTVAASSGNVQFSAQNKTVELGSGEISTVVGGRPPEPAKPIPLSVMLRVAKPRKLTQTAQSMALRGQTDTGARVFVNDRPARVDQQGKFRIDVPLRFGKNQIVVVAENAMGMKRAQELPRITVQKENVVDSADVRWGKRSQTDDNEGP